ncbi:hypothetical protein [Thalassovita taeanensis]|uniref:Uncharacterized protein n=1 Tax=Thalassovita taeanensis TaxID=657014 RepID=A0A1H9ALV5_9RHOB|nr:hypothetical protein [Thalassovita taeanensis]SEP77555.1 hypothetical protein SAMN04488092_102182 [Thalassovita taeanensis]
MKRSYFVALSLALIFLIPIIGVAASDRNMSNAAKTQLTSIRP